MLNKKQLLEIGFAEKEASVYLALLEAGQSTVSYIARKAGINRTTGYDILEMLSGKGLVSVIGQGNIRQYAAEDPRKIIQYSENRLRQAQTELEASKKLLPELKSIFNKTEKPKVKFYEGLNGIREVYEDTLTANKKLVGYACAETLLEAMPDFPEDYIKRRVAKGIHARGVLPDTPAMRKFTNRDKEQLRESRLVPADKLNLDIEINIYDNKVMMVSFKEELGIIIESQKIADAQKQIFELAWEAAGKYQDYRNGDSP